jgi:hypothetical protein
MERIPQPGIRKHDIEFSPLISNKLEEPVEIGHAGNIALHAGDAFTDLLHRFLHLLLAAARYIYVTASNGQLNPTAFLKDFGLS